MTLKDTVDLMLSNDWQDRFKAEYYQLKYRYQQLEKMLIFLKNGKLEFKPNCPITILETQLCNMKSYLTALEQRADIEGIELEKM